MSAPRGSLSKAERVTGRYSIRTAATRRREDRHSRATGLDPVHLDLRATDHEVRVDRPRCCSRARLSSARAHRRRPRRNRFEDAGRRRRYGSVAFSSKSVLKNVRPVRPTRESPSTSATSPRNAAPSSARAAPASTPRPSSRSPRPRGRLRSEPRGRARSCRRARAASSSAPSLGAAAIAAGEDLLRRHVDDVPAPADRRPRERCTSGRPGSVRRSGRCPGPRKRSESKPRSFSTLARSTSLSMCARQASTGSGSSSRVAEATASQSRSTSGSPKTVRAQPSFG